jgi:hypothetical protein
MKKSDETFRQRPPACKGGQVFRQKKGKEKNMPFFKIETSRQVNDTDIQSMLEKASGFISEMLAKPQKFVMVSIEANKQMMFGKDAESAAFVQLKSIGLPTGRCAEYSSRICQFLNDELGIAPDRVFIDFKDLERNMFGWNGKTF